MQNGGKPSTQRLVVTGGFGFIGSNFIHYILKTTKSLRITNVDNKSMGSNPANLKDIERDKRYTFVKGDLADYPFLQRIMKRADLVVNFAAQTHVDRSIANAEPFFESNTRGVFNLVRAIRNSRVKRVVHISTDEVYGSIDQGSFLENSPLTPSSPYSATKAAADLLIGAYNTTYNLGIVTLRSTNNFGPWQHPEKFIPKTIIRGLKGMQIPLYGGGKQVRDWIFVEDFCNAVKLALDHGHPGETYNVSAGNKMPNRQIATRLLRKINNPDASLLDVEDRPGHDIRYSLNSRKASLQLGWKPRKSFDDAIVETVDWYKNHELWWRSLASAKVIAETPWKERW